MKTIRTTRQANYRIRATDGDNTAIVPLDDSISDAELQHAQAARALCVKMGWGGRLVGGTLSSKGKFVCMVWVFDDSKDKRPLSPVIEVYGPNHAERDRFLARE